MNKLDTRCYPMALQAVGRELLSAFIPLLVMHLTKEQAVMY